MACFDTYHPDIIQAIKPQKYKTPYLLNHLLEKFNIYGPDVCNDVI